MKKKIIGIILLLLFIMSFIYLNSYYKAVDVDKYLNGSKEVKVIKIDNGYYFDGVGKNTSIVFYPGAKVEYTSYSPLLYSLASDGIDCFLIKMPFNIAFFNTNAASNIIKNYKYDNWYMMGHSLGGVVAANYANKNDIDGLILLASYPTEKVNTKLLSIYGNKDGVLNIDKYNKSRKYFPSDYKEIIIKNGNHSGFGNYGKQKKDNDTSLSNKEQQEKTIDAIIEFIKENN